MEVTAATVIGSEVKHHVPASEGLCGLGRVPQVGLHELDTAAINQLLDVGKLAAAEIVSNTHRGPGGDQFFDRPTASQ